MIRIFTATSALLVSLVASAATAVYFDEYVTGITKQCFYEYAGSLYSLTIKANQVCPMTIEV